ncbi:hypothetical protein FCM35_KLT09602 [Carex littledalei]|uniref:DUF6821 domain-containing protein n=1 Tax=Carex littledalei TaxID=544730 RepID=A0A833RJ03_9POAL|nr:hypothetical protein FCM35_KLT09602 [Carex littledalei]
MAEVVDLDEWEVLSCNNSSCKDEFEEDDFTYLDYFSQDQDLEQRGEISSVTCDEHEQDSIGELGFGEMEVLNEFYLNQIDDGIVNLEGESEQIHSENLNSSVFPFQGIDNSDSVFSSKSKGEQNGDCSNSSLKLGKGLDEQNISFDENKPESTKNQISKVQDGSKGDVLLVWWKVPVEVIKYCVFGVRPVWSISMAMGFLGFLMFSRSYYLYKMKQKDSKTRLQVKVRFDEKKRAVVQTRAARLNKVVSFVRRDPILRTLHPAFGVTPFPAMSSFQWAP